MVILRLRRAAFKYIFLVCIIGFQGLCMQGEVTKSVFGTMPDGTKIYILRSKKAPCRPASSPMALALSHWTYQIVTTKRQMSCSAMTPCRLRTQPTPKPSLGACHVGRYANGIGRGTFVLDGKRYDLPKNDGDDASTWRNCQGSNKRAWSAHEIPMEWS